MGGGSNSPEPIRKVMVVADPTRESASALEYALSHALLENDELILLHIGNPSFWRSTFSTFMRRPSSGSSTGPMSEEGAEATGSLDFLEEMKNLCKVEKPKLRVRTQRMEMEGRRDKASIILAQSKEIGVDLIVIGQRRSLSTAILGYRRSGGFAKGTRMLDTAEQLIVNSKCTCVGVQKKGQNAGYLLNTKTQKNFWLLA